MTKLDPSGSSSDKSCGSAGRLWSVSDIKGEIILVLRFVSVYRFVRHEKYWSLKSEGKLWTEVCSVKPYIYNGGWEDKTEWA